MDPVLQMFSVFHPCHLVSPYHFCAHHPNLQQPSSFSRTCPQLEPLLPHIDWKCSEQWAWGCHTQGPFLITKIISQSFPSEQATVPTGVAASLLLTQVPLPCHCLWPPTSALLTHQPLLCTCSREELTSQQWNGCLLLRGKLGTKGTSKWGIKFGLVWF